jgi:enoyl-CoA hydratase
MSVTTPTSDVVVSVQQGIMTIQINRPEARNAVTRAVAEGVAAALDQLDADDGIAVGVLTGAGSHFCAGMDLKAFLTGELPIVEGRGFGGLVEAPPAKPLIAAVEGYALAGGFELALSCDLIVAGTGAQFGLPEAKRGLVAAAGGLMRLPELIPFNIAMELALTGDFIAAERAQALGLINEVVADGEALVAATTLAQRVASNGPLATRASKQIMVKSRDWSMDERWENQRAITDPVFASADAREGALAFAEKRLPRWEGK